MDRKINFQQQLLPGRWPKFIWPTSLFVYKKLGSALTTKSFIFGIQNFVFMYSKFPIWFLSSGPKIALLV